MTSVLSRIGIGAAKVETILNQNAAAPGDQIGATVHVEGGNEAQDIDAINLVLMTTYRTDDGVSIGVLSSQKANEAFTIKPGEKKAFDVRVAIPRQTPLTIGRTNVWLRTGLDIEWALDPRDQDQLQIVPNPHMQTLFEAVENLGFDLHEAECKQVLSGFNLTFAQELEFKPKRGPYAGHINEIELVMQPGEHSMDVRMEVDARMSGIGGLLGGETESKRGFSFNELDRESVEKQVEACLSR